MSVVVNVTRPRVIINNSAVVGGGFVTILEGYKDDAEAAALAAALSEQSAEDDAEIATTQAGIATTQAGIATTQAGIATTQAGIATDQAGIATTQACIATDEAASAEASKNQAAAYASAADSAADRAEAVVVSGDVSFLPTAGKVPIAYADDNVIDPNWIRGVLEPEQWLENVSANQGIVAPDSSEVDFTPQMMLEIKRAWIPANPTQEITLLNDGVMGLYITVDKKLRFNYYGVFETTQALGVSDDWVDIAIVNNDNEQDTTSFFVLVNGRLFDTVQVAEFSPLALCNMLEGEEGFSWIVSPGHCALTSAGTNKCQVPGDPIGLIRDLGPNGINAAQATAAARPLIGRVPVGGRRNILLNTENINSAYYSGINLIVGEASDGFYPIYETADVGPHTFRTAQNVLASGSDYIFQAIVKKGLRSKLRLSRYGFTDISEALLSYEVGFDLDTLVVTPGSNAGEGVIIDLGNDEFYIAACPKSPVSNPADYLRYALRLANPSVTDLSYAGDGSQPALWIKFPQAEVGQDVANRTPYQRVGSTARDVTEAGVQDCYYAYFDESDDVESATIPEITNGTLIIAGPNGVWIDDDINAAAGTFSIGPTTYTGGPAGLITTLLGGFIKAFLIGRQLTESELEAHLNQCRQLGAPGLIIESDEEVKNGTFDTDLTDWGKGGDSGGSGTVTWVDGKMRVARSGADISGVQSGLNVISGQAYIGRRGPITNVSGAGTAQLVLRNSAAPDGGSSLFSFGAGKGSIYVSPSTANRWIHASVREANGVYDFDDISFRKLVLTPWEEL